MAQEGVNPLDVLIDAFSTAKGQEFAAQFLKDPVPGSGQFTDPPMDWEHSTGSPPGYTPDHVDIIDTWAIDFRPMPMDGFFTPTDRNQFWAPTGMHDVPTAGFGTMHTFVGDIPHDGSQYADGAYLFGFTLAETPPAEVAGRCEFVVWINDLGREITFVNHPTFPGDPAGGTNLAVGLGINPEGQGITSTFALELTEAGNFLNSPEIDVRSFITPEYVGITVPMNQITDLAQINYYTFCVEDGFSFAPEDTGADQTGLIEVTNDDLGIISIEEAPPPPTTTTSTTLVETTTTAIATTAATATPTSTPESTEAGDGEFPWWILIVLGLGLGGWGLFLLYGNKDPCKELYEAWLAAQKTCDEAQANAGAAAEECIDAEFELEDLEDERKELCKAWPPACWSSEEGGWIEDDQGNRITSRDVHMRKMALGEVWSDYKAGRLSATEAEAKWREMDTPEFREELRESDETFKEMLEEIDSDLTSAEARADKACREAEEAQKVADEACAAARAARRKYEECIEKAVAKAAAVTSTGEAEEKSPASAPGPSTATTPTEPGKDPCEGVESKRKYERAGKTEQIRVNVDFSLITGVAEGSERRIAAGQELTFGLNGLARDLDFVGDMAGARSAGLHVGGAVNGFAQGTYVAAGAGVIQGGIDAAMATDLAPEVPTSPVQVGTEFLEGVARLGASVASNVSRWMKGNQIMVLWTTMFYQVIKATPYTIWECHQGIGWVCVEKVWEYEVGKLQKHPPNPNKKSFLVESNVNRARFQAEIRRQAQIAANRVRNDARRLIEWRARHEPGPCR